MLATSSSESDLSEPEHLIEEFEVTATIGKFTLFSKFNKYLYTNNIFQGEHSNDETDLDMEVVSCRGDSEHNGSQLLECQDIQQGTSVAEKDTILPELEIRNH